MAVAPTSKIETITIVRPLKVSNFIRLICSSKVPKVPKDDSHKYGGELGSIGPLPVP